MMAIEPNPLRLTGTVALVTGASRGIGRAIATTLAGAGAHVALAARDVDRLEQVATAIRAARGLASVYRYDAGDSAAAHSLVRDVEHAHGKIDLLVNNAGVNGPGTPFVDRRMDQWWQVFEINVRGPALLCHAVLQGMVQRKSGRIINVSSGLGNFAKPGTSDYSASKTALTRLSESIAAEVQDAGVYVFAISPGMVQTDMTAAIPSLRAWTDWDSAEAAGALCVEIALGRLDKLSGCFVGVREGIDEILAAADEILATDMHVLRMARLPLREV